MEVIFFEGLLSYAMTADGSSVVDDLVIVDVESEYVSLLKQCSSSACAIGNLLEVERNDDTICFGFLFDM